MHPLVAIVVAAFLSISLVACDGDAPVASEETDRRTGPAPAVEPSPAVTQTVSATPSPTATATTSRALAPDRAIAVDFERGALIEIEIPTGRFVGELDAELDEAGLGEGAGGLDHSPARNSVLLSRVVTAANQQIVEVPLDDGRVDVVTNGHTAAVAPDGGRIAVGRRELVDQGRDQVVLEIRTFGGQVLGHWADPVAAEEPVRISNLTWSPDGTQLGFQLQFEDGAEVRTLDVTADDGSIQGASRKVQPLGDLRMLAVPQFRPGDGALVAVDRPGLDPNAQQRWRIVVIDHGSGQATGVLVETDRAVTMLDFDHSGQHLLYIEGHAHPSRNEDHPSAPALFYWHDGASIEVSQGLTNVTW